MLFVVDTLTTYETGPPLIGTVGAVHMAAVGAPAHAKEALPEKPAPGVSSRRKSAVCPATSVMAFEPGAAGEIAIAGFTVALRPITCGELGASSLIVINAERTPIASGKSDALMEQVAPTA